VKEDAPRSTWITAASYLYILWQQSHPSPPAVACEPTPAPLDLSPEACLRAFEDTICRYQEYSTDINGTAAINYERKAQAGKATKTGSTHMIVPSASDFRADVEINARRILTSAQLAYWNQFYKPREMWTNKESEVRTGLIDGVVAQYTVVGLPERKFGPCVVVEPGDTKCLENHLQGFPEQKREAMASLDREMRLAVGAQLITAGIYPWYRYSAPIDCREGRAKIKKQQRDKAVQAAIGLQYAFNGSLDAAADDSEEYDNIVCITDEEFVGDIQGAAEDVFFEPLLSAKEAAKLLGVHEKTVQALARSGDVPCIRFGKYWRFRASVLDTWLKERLVSDHQSRRVS
jgi:excisionase family DNA binding protein